MSSGTWRRRAPGRSRLMVIVASGAIALTTLVAAPPAQAGTWTLPALPAGKSVPGHPLTADAGQRERARLASELKARDARSALVTTTRPRAAWPAGGTATVTAGTAGRPVGGLSLQVAEAGTVVSPGQAAQVAASVVPHSATVAAGVRGVLMTLTAANGAIASGGKVRVRLGYAGFAGEYGGAWASRLRLVELPRCALTTPGVAACRAQHPLATVNDGADQTLTATVSLPSAPGWSRLSAGAAAGANAQPLSADAAEAGMVVAATSGPSGSDGDYTATPMLSSGTWTTQQGDFTYQYPITVPPSLGGSAPSVALGYDSQSIDGETSAANTQGGWIGDGWGYSPGYIERSYQPCSQDGIAGSGDECWAGYNAVLSLNGRSGQLVKDDATGTWHLQGDDGTSVQLETGADNGLWHGEYWVVTTADGTKYYFGLNHLPGTASGGSRSFSAWGVPVYTPNSGDPCYSAATGASSYCANMGWQWNLDYVVDPDGNLTAYRYTAETNYYEMGGGQNNGTGTLNAYNNGGYPISVSYGWLLSDAVAGTSPAVQVLFASSNRCTSTSAANCTSNENGTYWPDVPWDLNCGSSGTCTNYSPTFWLTQMLTSITTEVLASAGGSSYNHVDSYTLNQCGSTTSLCFPAGAGSDSVIFLNSITRTGVDGGGNLSLPATAFSYEELDNRVPGLVPAAPPVNRPRINAITTATGAQIDVIYDDTDGGTISACSRNSGGSMPSAEDANTMPCFPVHWTPPGASQIEDWFNKSLVYQISVFDATGAAADTPGSTDDSTSPPAGAYGSPPQVTSYYYKGGAAWHQNESPVVASGQRTWDQYRGFARVDVITGVAPDPQTQTIYTYMRGMNGDPLTSGTATVNVTDSLGNSNPDDDWLAGQLLETDTYTKSGGTIDKKVVNGPWTYAQTASQAEPDGAPTLTAHMLQQSASQTLELFANSTWGTDATTTYYNSDAQVTAVDADSAGSTETCTSTSYAAAPTGNPMMLDYPQQVTEVSGAATAGACPAAGPADMLSDAEYYYDQPSSTVSSLGSPGGLASPGGLVTGVAKAAAWTLGTALPISSIEDWVPQSATGYDEYGRVTSSADGDGNVTTTAYTPATGALPTSTAVTNAKGWTATTTTLDQGRQLPVKVTDQNNNSTTETYDPLGRLTSVTTPLDQSDGGVPTDLFSYSLTGSSEPAITTQTLREDGTYGVSVSIYDGMGQLRQVQQTPTDNEPGMLVTDTFYDTDGWVDKTSGPYYVGNVNGSAIAPSTTMFQPYADSTVPSQTVTTYDGQGRPTVSALWSDGAELWETDTAYPGMDETDVTPPAGAAPSTTIINILGQQTQTWQYHAASADGTASDADVTKYTYEPNGQVQSITDPDGNTTSYLYDRLGQQLSVDSPDSGTTSTTYDAAGNVQTTTTARGTITYDYDDLNRKTAEYAGSGAFATELASWTYDTKVRGHLYYSTSYGSSGQWTETITGYNAAYEPTGTSTTVPGSAGFGTAAFTTANVYTPLTGLLASTNYSQDGGLPAETVGYDYDLGGLPVSSGGTAAYAADTSYNALGQVTRETLGARPDQVVRTYQLDPATAQVETVTTNLQTVGSSEQSTFAPSDTVNYTYDDAGLVTSESDVQNSGGAQLACFAYDDLAQLATAWTDTGAQNWTNANGSDPTAVGSVQAAPPGAVGGCASTAPSASSIGGPDPYWESYQYNEDGDRKQETAYAAPWAAADDVIQQLSYPAAGTGTGAQPADAPSQVVTAAGSAGSVTTTPTYDGAGDLDQQVNQTMTGTAPATVPPGAQDVTYTLAGQVASVTLPGTGGSASYQYDADGNLIYQGDPKSGSVLYLDGGAEELTLTGSGTVTGYRFYPAPDGSSVVRTTAATATGTGDPSGGGAVSDDLADLQGTATQEITVTAAGGLAESRRYFDPYGNQVSTAVAWGDNKGFVGDPADPDSGLDLLGAREYDPVTGGFWSPDPVFQPGTMAQGGYAYSADDPATRSDPTGLCATGPDNEPLNCNTTPIGGGTAGGSGGSGGGTAGTTGTQSTGIGDRILGLFSSGWGWFNEGANDLDNLTGINSAVSCATHPSVAACGQGLSAAALAALSFATGGTAELGDAALPALEEVGNGLEDALAQLTCGQSFAPGTKVLLASGAAVPIADLKPGDKVLATNTRTGKTSPEAVTAVLARHDTDLYDLTVKSHGRAQVIHTTANHLFWDPSLDHGWTPAKDLKPGIHLQTPDGQSAVVVGGSVPPVHDGWMWDLTVPGNNDHDFYVVVVGGGSASGAVLVHNEDGCLPGVGDVPRKVVNSNMGHIDEERAARAGFDTVQSAQAAVRQLGESIGTDGFPEGTIPDTARSDRLLVPFGDNGYAVYQIAKNGNAVFKTILIAR